MGRAFLLLAAWAMLSGISAQALAVENTTSAAGGGDTVSVALGEAASDLFGPWRFHTGDDPSWADSNLDDRAWEQLSLRSPEDGPDPDLGKTGFVPGWTAGKHPRYSGYAWYRLRVEITGAKRGLALKMPVGFDDAYQVFVDGQEIGGYGRFGKHSVLAYFSQPKSFPLPRGLRDGVIVIAIRMWMDSSTLFTVPDAGGLHGPPMIGLAPEITTQVRVAWDRVAQDIGSGFLEMLVLLLALCVSVTHYWLDRDDRAYLWLGLVCLVTLLGNLVLLLSNFTNLIPQTFSTLSRDVAFAPARVGLWVIFWAAWFGLGPPRWLGRAVWVLVALLTIGTTLLRPPLYGQVVPVHAAVYLQPALLWVKLGLAVLLIWVTYRGIRENRAEGWLALPAILLAVAANYQHELRLIHIRVQYSLFGFHVSLGQISTVLSLLLVTLMGSRRFLKAQQQKVQWRLEVEQASELQQVIIPRVLPQLPGLRIQSEYRPSRDVGGDFFQIIPDERDGSVLVVVGDVTGKGLRAGMLVALLVGAIDTAARDDPHPASLLSTINERLCERGYATATCLVMKIEADGLLTIANAGHLPPYLNGEELTMEGALPLGTLPGMDYGSFAYELDEGDTLMLMTDGVVEAQDERGTLFGFERIGALVANHASATEIADAAQRFGQEDDILVLRVERTVSKGVLTAAVA